MKKIICILFLSFLFFPLHSKDKINFTYSNKKIGIGVIFPDDWSLSTNSKNAHEYFKGYFRENKKDDESPLFFGMKSNQQLFVRLLIEKYDSDIDGYFEFLNLQFKQENIELISVKKLDNTIQCVFKAKKNDFIFKFKETLIQHKNHVIRLSFWSLDLFLDKYNDEMNDIINNTFFIDSKKNNVWLKLWDNLESKLKKVQYDFVELGEPDTEDITEDINESGISGIFYEIKSKNNSVYLMGSVHMGRPDFYPFRSDIEDIFKNTKNIVVEVNINDKEIMEKARALSGSAFLEDNKTIDEVISDKLYMRLEDFFSEYGLPIEKFNRYQVWFLVMVLNSLQYMNAGYIDQYGVDKYFLNSVDENKNIIELETFDEQIELLKNINSETYLAYTLLHYKAGQIYINDLIDSWKRGDSNELEKLIFKNSSLSVYDFDNFYEELFFNRNLNFIEKLEKFLNKKENYFVIIGAGHLVGDKGVIETLKKKGYEVIKY